MKSIQIRICIIYFWLLVPCAIGAYFGYLNYEERVTRYTHVVATPINYTSISVPCFTLECGALSCDRVECSVLIANETSGFCCENNQLCHVNFAQCFQVRAELLLRDFSVLHFETECDSVECKTEYDLVFLRSSVHVWIHRNGSFIVEDPSCGEDCTGPEDSLFLAAGLPAIIITPATVFLFCLVVINRDTCSDFDKHECRCGYFYHFLGFFAGVCRWKRAGRATDDPMKNEWLYYVKGVEGKKTWLCKFCCCLCWGCKTEREPFDFSPYEQEYAQHLNFMPGSVGMRQAECDFEANIE